MGKSKQKDALYVKPSEYADGMGGKRVTAEVRMRSMPFNHCALCFGEIRGDGVFTDDGSCFDADCMQRQLKTAKTHPATGRPLDASDVYVLHVHKNDDGDYHCPITQKVITNNTHVVAVRTSGNAYSYDAVNEMNIKAKNWCDLLTGQPLKKSDIISIQDPHKVLVGAAGHAAQGDAGAGKRPHDGDGEEPPSKKAKKEKKEKKEKKAKTAAAPVKAYTASGTSTLILKPEALDSPEVAAEKEMFRQLRGLGSEATGNARVETTLGDIDVKLFCGACPKTCYNFIQLAKQGYYEGTTFHRVIKGFMMQGGDPTATGAGGSSLWGKAFEDEIAGNPHRHDGRGVLSMANSGPNSNGSQFFITFGAAPHLDGKHTVFGQVVLTPPCAKVLDDAEQTPTDAADRPRAKITMQRVDVYRDPFANFKAAAKQQKPKKEKLSATSAEGQERRQWFSAPQPDLPNSGSSSVGKYLAQAKDTKAAETPAPQAKVSALSKALGAKKGGWDFSGWQVNRLDKLATDIVDEQSRQIYGSVEGADKFRTDLVDSLKIAEDAGDRWEEEWRSYEADTHEEKQREQDRMRAWQEGELKAGSRESARDREERMHVEGTLESNRVPPHPKALEDIVRKVRYARLMPIPEAPKALGEKLFLSEAFPVLPTLVDNLLSIPGITIDNLLQLPVEEHDKLIEANFSSMSDPTFFETVQETGALESPAKLQQLASTVEGAHDAAHAEPPAAAAEAEAPTPAAHDVERTPEPAPEPTTADNVFGARQARLVDDAADPPAAPSAASPPPTAAPPRPQRQRALTASQTVQAIAMMWDTPVEETMPQLITAVGQTKNLAYVEYYWALAQKALPADSQDTLVWDAYIEALGFCGGEGVPRAYHAIERMKSKGITPSIDTWNNLMLCYRKSGDTESALKVADNIRMYANLSPNHRTFLMTIQTHRDDMTVDADASARRALNVMYEMTQVYRLEPTREHYETLLSVLSRVSNQSNWYLEAQTQAKQMKHLGMPWSIEVYQTLMWIEANRGDIDRVRELFATYRKRKLPPTDRIYSAVLQAYACAVPMDGVVFQAGQFQWAQRKRDEWEQSHDAEPPLQRWRETLCDEALQIYSLAKGHDGPLHRTVYTLLRVVGRLRPQEIRRVWEEEARPLADDYPRMWNSYIYGLLHLADAGDVNALDDAEAAFVEATRKGLRLNREVYQKMMEAHVKTGREGSVDVALDYMHAMERSGQNMTSGGVRRLKNLIDRMGPKRDAIRRAKRLMERRTQLSNNLFPDGQPVLGYPGEEVAMPGVTPDGFVFPTSETGVNADGTLAGESWEDRSAALAQMGYQPMNIENVQELRKETKVNDWLSYTARNPHLNLNPEHPSFDKMLLQAQKVTPQGDALNPWHQEQMKELPQVYRADGTVDHTASPLTMDSDSPTELLMAMQRSQHPADLYNMDKPLFSPTYAHTARNPESWTENQESFMQQWLETDAGKDFTRTAEEAKELRHRVFEKRQERDHAYPDEDDFVNGPPPGGAKWA